MMQVTILVCCTGLGRLTNPDYMVFINILVQALRSPSLHNKVSESLISASVLDNGLDFVVSGSGCLLQVFHVEHEFILYSRFASLQSKKKRERKKIRGKKKKGKVSFCTAVRQMLISQVPPSSDQGGLSSGWSLIKMVFHQGGLSPGWSFIRVVFY